MERLSRDDFLRCEQDIERGILGVSTLLFLGGDVVGVSGQDLGLSIRVELVGDLELDISIWSHR